MSKRTLKFDNVEVNKKGFHTTKQPIALDSVLINQITVYDKSQHSDTDFKYFIGYEDGNIIIPLCIILSQMSGYIKYFDNGGKNMSFMIKGDSVLSKYNEIWNKVKKTLNIKFNSVPVYNEKYESRRI